MPEFQAETTEFAYCCGVNEIGGFENYQWGTSSDSVTKKDVQKSVGPRTGLLVANFIDDEDCKFAYGKLTNWFKIRYQAPLKMGKHGRKICLVVFDTKSRKSKTDPKPNWPFKDKK